MAHHTSRVIALGDGPIDSTARAVTASTVAINAEQRKTDTDTPSWFDHNWEWLVPSAIACGVLLFILVSKRS